MKAIILAAGVGSRISRHVDKPKSLIDIKGKPLLARTVEMLKRNDIQPVIVAGYEHRQMEQVFAGSDVPILHNPFYRVTNSLGSLWFAKEYLPDDEDVLMMNADVFWEQDIMDILLSEEKDVVLLADSSLKRLDEGDYFFGCDGNKIMKYGKELAREIRTHEYVGIARIRSPFMPYFKAKMNEMIEAGKYDGWWENILYACSEERDVYVRDVAGHFWAEVDYIDDYERIMNYLWEQNRLQQAEK